jgi:hypothetical protein
VRDERIRCRGDPRDGVRNDQTRCIRLERAADRHGHPHFVGVDRPDHYWEIVPTEDAIRCSQCGKTYVGGPTVVVSVQTGKAVQSNGEGERS